MDLSKHLVIFEPLYLFTWRVKDRIITVNILYLWSYFALLIIHWTHFNRFTFNALQVKNVIAAANTCKNIYTLLHCFYWKHVCFYVFMSNRFLISLGTCSTPKLWKWIISIFVTLKQIQYVPTSAYSSRFIRYTLIHYSFRQIISRIKSIDSRFILIILLYFKVW